MSQKKRSTKIGQRRKPSHKGKKGLRGQPLIYEEVKVKLNLTITPTAKSKLILKAEEQQCSVSSLLEELARSNLLDDFQVNPKVQITE